MYKKNKAQLICKYILFWKEEGTIFQNSLRIKKRQKINLPYYELHSGKVYVHSYRSAVLQHQLQLNS